MDERKPYFSPEVLLAEYERKLLHAVVMVVTARGIIAERPRWALILLNHAENLRHEADRALARAETVWAGPEGAVAALAAAGTSKQRCVYYGLPFAEADLGLSDLFNRESAEVTSGIASSDVPAHVLVLRGHGADEDVTRV